MEGKGRGEGREREREGGEYRRGRGDVGRRGNVEFHHINILLSDLTTHV